MTAILIMFFAGVVLILAEFFLPGMILGILGFLLLLASTVTGVIQFPEYAIFIISGELFGFFISLIGGFYLITQTPLQHLFILHDTMDSAQGYSGPSQDKALLGAEATVHSALRPSGIILVGTERIDAVSDGTFIDAGESVRIIAVEGHRVVVEAIAPESPPLP